MAYDQATLPATGDGVAIDKISSVDFQRVKMALGAEGSATDAVGGAGAVSAAVQRFTLASDDPAVTGIGSLTETAPASDTASSGLNGRLQRIAQRLTSLIGLLPTALGAGGGLKVDGSGTALPVSAASLPLPSGAATESTLSGVLTTSDFDTKTGSLTETAPATDTASSGLNGRLQRIAQRITSLIALLPGSLGQKTAANSLAVTLASDDVATATLGAKTDAKSTATDTTSVSIVSVLKQISASCQAFVFGAGTAAAAERVTLASDDPAVATLGATSGAAVITDANGTVQQYLRGLVKQWIAGTLVVGAGTNLIGKVKTKFIVAAASAYTRPANTTPYTANDAVSNNATIGSVTAISLSLSDVNDDTITLERIRIMSTDTGVAGKAFRVWLFNSDPTANSGVQGGDNIAWSQKQAGFVGSMSGTFRAFQDGSGAVCVPDEGSRIITTPVSGAKTIFALLQTLNDFTPSANSTTFTLTAEGFQGAA